MSSPLSTSSASGSKLANGKSSSRKKKLRVKRKFLSTKFYMQERWRTQSADHRRILNLKAAHSVQDSKQEGKLTLEWLLAPLSTSSFFKDVWEKTYTHVVKNKPSFFANLLSTQDIQKILLNNNVLFSKNIDVTSYKDGKRETHNPPGRAFPGVVWDYYSQGCSIRFLNPQTFHAPVWKLLAMLQEYFGCFVGANVYLTPPGTQGFAPHYDDIEAFVIQLEGRKRWRLYNPRTDEEVLPRFSSPNFNPDEIGEPIYDVVLEAGDILYFPRGVIHQAHSIGDVHSLHITVSTYQKTSWADLLELAVPAALQSAINEDVDYRKGLPLHYLNHMGVANDQEASTAIPSLFRMEFERKLRSLVKKLCQYLPIDGAVDQLGKKCMHDVLPPVLSSDEKVRTVLRGGEFWEDGDVVNHVELQPDTRIRLLRANILRLVLEEEEVRVYFSAANSREYHGLGEEPLYFEVSAQQASMIEELIDHYPNYVRLESLSLDLIESMQMAHELWDRGLIMTKEPLEGFD